MIKMTHLCLSFSRFEAKSIEFTNPMLNRITRQQAALPRNLTQWGSITGAFMMVGLLSLYGILLSLDRSDYSPLMMVSGISFFGISILYPIWCLRLGRWILSTREESVIAAQEAK